MRRNLGHLEVKKQTTAETKRLNVVKKIRTNFELLDAKKNTWTRNEAGIGEKVTTNLEYFAAEKQITPERTRHNLVQK